MPISKFRLSIGFPDKEEIGNRKMAIKSVARFAGSADSTGLVSPRLAQSLALGLAKTAASQLGEFVRWAPSLFGQSNRG
jgi:hypothetical protein